MQHKSRPKTFFLALMTLSVIGNFATELYLPSMPSMVVALHSPIHIIQLSITIYVFGYSIGSLVSGTLSDKYGRRPIIFTALTIGTIGSAICCIAFNIDSLLIGRLIQGLGFSGLAVISRSIVRDITDDRASMSRLASIMGILYATAMAIAPIIGGYIEKYTFWRINFILLFAMAIASIMICYDHLPETNCTPRKISLYDAFNDYIAVFSNKQFLIYNATSSLVFTGFVAYQTISSFLLQIRVGLSPTQFGYTAIAVTGSLLVGNIINRRFVLRVGMDNMMRIGCYMFVVAGSLAIIGGLFNLINIYTILIPVSLFTSGAGLVYPNASSGAITIFDTKAGTASSVYNFLQMTGGTLGSYLVSISHATTQAVLGVIFTIVGLVGIILGQNRHSKANI